MHAGASELLYCVVFAKSEKGTQNLFGMALEN
jgi:hypothetical protein